MTPDEVKALRKELGCTAKDLGTALGVESQTIFAWESGELFPTKQYIDKMETLRAQGPSAFPKKGTAKKSVPPSGMARLADPELWAVVRKLARHDAFYRDVIRLSADYDDPADDD